MTYEELSALWKKQRDAYQQWELKLRRSPIELRDAVESVLSPPNLAWEEVGTKTMHRYVEVIDFYELDNPQEAKLIRSAAITEDGALVFGIGIAFDHGLNSYPKNRIHMPLASRITPDGAEYSFFRVDNKCPDSIWSKDVMEFAKKIVIRYAEYFSHDPHLGLGNKTRMGFL